MKLKTLLLLLFISIMTMNAKAASQQEIAAKIVETISINIELTQDQESALLTAAEQFVSVVSDINEQYADSPSELIAAKSAAWSEYNQAVQNILSTAQYAQLLSKQEEKRQQIYNQSLED